MSSPATLLVQAHGGSVAGLGAGNAGGESQGPHRPRDLAGDLRRSDPQRRPQPGRQHHPRRHRLAVGPPGIVSRSS